MKTMRCLCVYALTLLVLSVSVITHPAAAQANGIVVVDMQQLEGMSLAGKALREKIKEKRDSLRAEITKEETSLRAEQQKIMASRKDLSEEDFKAKAMAFDAKFKGKQEKFAKKREAFEKSALEAHGKLRSEVVSVVGTISNEKKYTLVVSRQAVVIVEKTIDITSEAMKRLNENVKSIPFK